HRVEFVGNHAQRDAIKIQTPRAYSRRTSVQSSTHHPISGSCRRNEDIAGSDSTSARVLRIDSKETDPFEKGTSRSRRKSAASGALQGDHVSDSAQIGRAHV